MKPEYNEGPKAKRGFERTMVALFRVRYAFHRPLVQSEIEILQLFVGPGSQITIDGDRVIGCYGLQEDVAAFQSALRKAGCSPLRISVPDQMRTRNHSL